MDNLRPMPYSAEAETGCLSCMLQTPELIDVAAEQRLTELFYNPAHRLLAETLVALRVANKPVDIVSISHHLIDHQVIEKVGGNAILSELYSFVPTAAHWPYYLGILRAKHTLRRVIEVCSESIQNCYGACEDLTALLDEMEIRTLAIRPHHATAPSDSMARHLDTLLDAIQQRIKLRGGLSGHSTGFSWLDEMTGGLRPEIWYVGARPSVGKTSFLLQVIKQCIEDGRPCGMFSLEMSRVLIGKRLLALLSGVPFGRIMGGSLSRDEFDQISDACATLKKATFLCDDRCGLTHSQIRAKARRWKREFGVEFIGVDYLQRMAPPERRGGNRNVRDEHAENSTALADASKELGIPWVVLAQLNRDCETQERPPRLSDFESCGRLEQDADVALLLSPATPRKKEEKAPAQGGQGKGKGKGPGDQEMEPDTNSPHMQVLWQIAKQRNGPTGESVHLFERQGAAFLAHPVG